MTVLFLGPVLTIAGLCLSLTALLEERTSVWLSSGLALAIFGIGFSSLAPRMRTVERGHFLAAAHLVRLGGLACLTLPLLSTVLLYPTQGTGVFALAWLAYLVSMVVALLVFRCRSCARPLFRKNWGFVLSVECAHCGDRLVRRRASVTSSSR